MAEAGRVEAKAVESAAAPRAPAAQGARLAFFTGGRHWLVRLADTGEVIGVPDITRVPLTHSWYRGIANIRGTLYGIVDFADFVFKTPVKQSPQSRVLLLGARFGELKAGLLVERVLGLRSVDSFERIPVEVEAAPWDVEHWREQSGQTWYEIDLARLVRDAAFLHVGR